ncbi:MAG: hypothetical protein JO112_09210, partial [Planctomycetes bacterium]|nr:hypothetical protein [Planctomycetota bacterium]
MVRWIKVRFAPWAAVAAFFAVALGLRTVWTGPGRAQSGPADASPDVIVGDIHEAMSYGSENDISAFSIGTTSCNIGTKPLDWIPEPNPNHPVIAQNLYRVKDGRIEQIGLSWLKHGFFALNEDLCGTCQSSPGNQLGVNCSDPYSAGLNGQQQNLGPRSQVNVSLGKYVLPFRRPVPPATKAAGRLQVRNGDLDPAQNAGAEYFVEAQYVHPQDAQAGKGANNASY